MVRGRSGKATQPDPGLMRAKEPLRVLVLENDPTDAELCIAELERAGFEPQVDIASAKAEFADRLEEKTFDVVLADYRLPDWTGLDALAHIQERGDDVPLILITGGLGDEGAVDCLKAGAADLVLKENLSRLPMAVRRALAEARSRRDTGRTHDLIRRLSLAVDQGPASIVITDRSGAIEYVNRRFTEMTGYAAAEVIGRNPRMLASGRTPKEVYADLWQTIAKGDTWSGEIQNRRRNGELFWDSVRIAPIRDTRGFVTHFLATQEDITEKKLAEQGLKEREERFRQIADNITEVVFITSADYSETLYVSPAYEKIWGRSCASLYENPWTFLDPVVEEDQPALIASIARIQQGAEGEEVEFRIVRPDGEVRWVLSHAAGIRNEVGEVHRIAGVALDITQRKAAEEALQESEARYRKLIEASFHAISISQGGILIEGNQGLADLFGYSLEEMIGRPITDFSAEESKPDVSRRVVEEVEGRYEAVGKRKDGKKIQLEATTRNHVVRGRTSRLTALRDITEVRALEVQLNQAQKMEAVGRLAGGVAHDFNNLLTVITSYTFMMLEGLEEGGPWREELDEIRKAALGATSLTRQLLAFSRQEVIQPREVMLQEILDKAGRLVRRLVGEDIDVATLLGPDPAMVMIDPGQLEQVVLNLVVNARDAMPTGGKLTLEATTVDLDEEYARTHWPTTPGRYAMLAVSDTGTGMSAEVQAHIFEPFFTTKEAGKGTGLGLPMVYGIVKQSGGFVWVYSEPEMGTTVKIYLPRLDGPTAPEAEGEPTARALHGSETILLVEDSPGVRFVARRTLEKYGYNVLEAPGGAEALALATHRQSPIHLLLTDVVMPEMSGRQVAERIAPLFPHAKVIFMSGYTDDAVVRHGVFAANVAYLQKPFTPSSLARKVREVLDEA